ncbi:TIGR01777 family oxidoreductase [Gammaproteobacteria bacterium]|nr:TIGR01777 family oxidoreductase [Gammaproteobacteria bacterium]
MKILIAGATGFIGRHLVKALLKNNHELTIVGRSKPKIDTTFKKKIPAHSWKQLKDLSPKNFDAVINLSGETISHIRWTKSIKKTIINSRIKATTNLIKWLLTSTKKTPHLYNASAVGVYGIESSNSSPPLTEDSLISPEQNDFLSQVGRYWEESCQTATHANYPVTILRFGVVMKNNEGFLKQLKPSFKLGLGAVLGSGEQMISWIHINDLTKAILFLLERPTIKGPVNICSPHPINQKSFAKWYAESLNRPLIFKLPKQIIKLLFGEMGKELLLSGQNVYPEKLLSIGFKFDLPNIKQALKK